MNAWRNVRDGKTGNPIRRVSPRAMSRIRVDSDISAASNSANCAIRRNRAPTSGKAA